MDRREVETALLEEVHRTTQALSTLARSSDWREELAKELKATCDEVERRLSGEDLAIALVSDTSFDERALLNALLGERLLGDGQRSKDGRLTIVRHSAVFDYSARLRDGTTERFSVKMPDRSALFGRSLAQAEQEVTAAKVAREERSARLEAARADTVAGEARVVELRKGLERSAEAGVRARTAKKDAEVRLKTMEAAVGDKRPLPALYRARPPWWAVWSWILRLLLRPLWRGPLRLQAARDKTASLGRKAAEAEDKHRGLDDKLREQLARVDELRTSVATLARELTEAKDCERAMAHVDRLRSERDKYDGERKKAFLSQVGSFGGPTPRDVVELTIEYPAKKLPPWLTLAEAPIPQPAGARTGAMLVELHKHADAFLCVGGVRKAPGGAVVPWVGELRRSMPELHIPFSKPDAAAADGVFKVLQRERPLILGMRFALRLRECIERVRQAQGSVEALHRKRLAALEAQRIPDPDSFRARQVGRMEAAIAKGAEDVERSAGVYVHKALEAVKAEYKAAIEACADRAALQARMTAINEGAPARVAEVLDQTSEHVAAELFNVTETLKTWASQEIFNRYQVVRRSWADSMMIVASELTRDDLEQELGTVQPVKGAMAAFEKERVGYGLGGAAAGAVLGTLILPGIGTAIGAFLGVFAGFLKGVESLKQECTATLDARLREVEQHVATQIAARKGDLVRVIQVSIDEALEKTLSKMRESIERMMGVERKAMEAENSKLASLKATAAALQESDGRLTSLVQAAETHLGSPGAEPERAGPKSPGGAPKSA